MKSQTELVNVALAKVTGGDSGQSFASEDVTLANAALVNLVDELNPLGVCNVQLSTNPDDLTIPPRYVQGLATLIALDIGPEFGRPAASDAERQNVMSTLRRINSAGPTYEVLQADYF